MKNTMTTILLALITMCFFSQECDGAALAQRQRRPGIFCREAMPECIMITNKLTCDLRFLSNSGHISVDRLRPSLLSSSAEGRPASLSTATLAPEMYEDDSTSEYSVAEPASELYDLVSCCASCITLAAGESLFITPASWEKFVAIAVAYAGRYYLLADLSEDDKKSVLPRFSYDLSIDKDGKNVLLSSSDHTLQIPFHKASESVSLGGGRVVFGGSVIKPPVVSDRGGVKGE